MNYGTMNQPSSFGTSGFAELVDFSILRSFEETQVDGEPDLVNELIDLYLGEAARQIALMNDGLCRNDWPSVKRAAHRLRGGSGNIGVVRVARVCDELEHLTGPDMLPLASELLHVIEYELARVRPVLLTERARRADENTNR